MLQTLTLPQTNKRTASCARCGQRLAPGQGRLDWMHYYCQPCDDTRKKNAAALAEARYYLDDIEAQLRTWPLDGMQTMIYSRVFDMVYHAGENAPLLAQEIDDRFDMAGPQDYAGAMQLLRECGRQRWIQEA